MHERSVHCHTRRARRRTPLMHERVDNCHTWRAARPPDLSRFRDAPRMTEVRQIMHEQREGEQR
jgi:hypothetical protein